MVNISDLKIGTLVKFRINKDSEIYTIASIGALKYNDNDCKELRSIIISYYSIEIMISEFEELEVEIVNNNSSETDKKQEPVQQEITYQDVCDYLNRLNGKDLITTYNRFYSIDDDYYESVNGKMNYRQIFVTVEDLVNCIAMKHITLKDFAKCIDNECVNSLNNYFFLAVNKEGNIKINSGEEFTVIPDDEYDIFVREVYATLFTCNETSNDYYKRKSDDYNALKDKIIKAKTINE